jgi:erythromycin esterase-like protein
MQGKQLQEPEIPMEEILDAEDAVRDFQRFPKWMWRNNVVIEFLEWLRAFNEDRAKKTQLNKEEITKLSPEQIESIAPESVGFFGLDMYSLFESTQEVLQYLQEADPELYSKAKQNYSKLGEYQDDISSYGISVSFGITESQEKKVVEILTAMLRKKQELVEKIGYAGKEKHFVAAANAKVVKDAENYYRNTMSGSGVTWSIRDTHMADTVADLFEFYEKDLEVKSTSGKPASKAIIWMHNSHIGDCRASQFGGLKELNIGQLCRERYKLEGTYLIGFSTYQGTVSAATSWGGPRKTFSINPGLESSYEYLFHHTGVENLNKLNNWGLLFRSNSKEVKVDEESMNALIKPRLHRAIGVQYVKKTERHSHYMKSCIPKQYDTIIHIDKSNYLQPIDEDEDMGD